MSRSVQQRASDLLRLGTLGQSHRCRLLAVDIRIKVQYPDPHLQIVQQCHNLYLIRLLVQRLHLSLTEVLNWQPILNECLVQNSIVLQLPRRQESHHQNYVIRCLSITEYADYFFNGADLRVIQFLKHQLQHILKHNPIKPRLLQKRLSPLQLLDYFLLQPLILPHINRLKDRERKRPIKTIPVPPSLPVSPITLTQLLHLYIKPLVIHELVQHETQLPLVTD